MLLTTALTALLLTAPSPADTGVANLPLVEVPATSGHRAHFAIVISGDGDWADFVQELSKRFAAAGVPVVGLKARSYMGRRPTPEQTAVDVARIIETYASRWQRPSVVLVGYSRGADWIPFILNRLPAATRARVTDASMLGLAARASFQFHLTDLMRETSRDGDLPLTPELEKLRGSRLLCMYGSDEVESGCRGADGTLMTIVGRSGGHHFDRNYDEIARTLLGRIGG